MWREFKKFLLSANVLALAIAVVIGAALNKVVSALVADFIMPIVAFAVPAGEWRKPSGAPVRWSSWSATSPAMSSTS